MRSTLDSPSRVHRIAVVIWVTIPFLGCAVAILLMWLRGWMGWPYLALLVGGWLTTGLGITIGFHRLLAHRSFETHALNRALWAVLGAAAAQGPPLTWCATHRKHHERSDQPDDPHSPHHYGDGCWNSIRGLVHSHMGWIFTNHTNDRLLQRYVPDLRKDRLLVAIERSYFLWVLLGVGVPTFIGWVIAQNWMGALLGLLWGGLVRIFLVHHVTWSINSICHIFGQRDYDSGDHSTNNFFCGLLGHGEGWHNNHHAFPTSARHGLRWWQIDLSWFIIRSMRFCRLAWDVRTPSQKNLATKRLTGEP